jgi:hypothetical protein
MNLLLCINLVGMRNFETKRQQTYWALAFFIAISIVLYFYGNSIRKQYKEDLAHGNGMPVSATVTTIYGRRPLVYIKFKYQQQLYRGDISVKHLDSIADGTIVRILISKLHPNEGIQYIGVDTLPTKAKGLKLIH